MKRTITRLLFAMLLLSPVACESDPLTGPPEIRLGRDECAECGMLISEDRYSSAAIVEQDGHREALVFDDFGCQLLAERKAKGPKVLERWVHDHESKAWVRAERSRFVYTDRVRTPMNFGIIAFSDGSAAQTRAAELGADVLDFETVVSAFSRNMEAIYGKADP